MLRRIRKTVVCIIGWGVLFFSIFSIPVYAESFFDSVGSDNAPVSSEGGGNIFESIQSAFAKYLGGNSNNEGSSAGITEMSTEDAEARMAAINESDGTDPRYVKIYELAADLPGNPSQEIRNVVEPGMYSIMNDADADVQSRVGALDFLNKFDSPGLTEALEKIAVNENQQTRDYTKKDEILADKWFIENVMNTLGKEGDISFLLSLLKDRKDALLYLQTVEALGFTRDSNARQELVSVLENENTALFRETAARALVQSGEEGVQTLENILKQNSDEPNLNQAKSTIIETLVPAIPTSQLIPLIGELLGGENRQSQSYGMDMIKSKAEFTDQDISRDLDTLNTLSSFSKDKLNNIVIDEQRNPLTRELGLYFLEHKFNEVHSEISLDLSKWDFVYEMTEGGFKVPVASITVTTTSAE
jgi:hypothetical protein